MGERIPIGRKTLKILIVDDEPHILEVLGVPKLCKTLIELSQHDPESPLLVFRITSVDNPPCLRHPPLSRGVGGIHLPRVCTHTWGPHPCRSTIARFEISYAAE